MNPHPNDPKGQAGAAKTPLHLIPTVAMTSEAEALAQGRDKYGENNWRESGVNAMTYVGAVLRHLLAWRDGEDVDPESGVSHLGHIRANCAILLDAAHVGKLVDDRPVHRKGLSRAEIHQALGMTEFDTSCRANIPPSTDPPYTVEELMKAADEPMSETNKSFVRMGPNPAYTDAPKEEIRGTMVNGQFKVWEESGVPDGLPPLPPVPEGFNRWVYRGTGWTNSHRRCTYAHPHNGSWVVCNIVPHGRYDTHYIEAVND
jgi:hypothetical protein